jgi:hypothetical protein
VTAPPREGDRLEPRNVEVPERLGGLGNGDSWLELLDVLRGFAIFGIAVTSHGTSAAGAAAAASCKSAIVAKPVAANEMNWCFP